MANQILRDSKNVVLALHSRLKKPILLFSFYPLFRLHQTFLFQSLKTFSRANIDMIVVNLDYGRWLLLDMVIDSVGPVKATNLLEEILEVLRSGPRIEIPQMKNSV